MALPSQNCFTFKKLRSAERTPFWAGSWGRGILAYSTSWLRHSRHSSPAVSRQPKVGQRPAQNTSSRGEISAPTAKQPWSRLYPRVALSPGRVEIMVLAKLELPPLATPVMRKAAASRGALPSPAAKMR